MSASENLLHELRDERRARERAQAETERLARMARAMDQLSAAVLSSTSTDVLLAKVLDLFVDMASAEVAVLRLREGDRLRSRAAVGLEEEVASGFSLPIAEGLPGEARREDGSPVLSVVPAHASCRSEAIRNAGVRVLHCLPLLDGDELVGVVYMGSRQHRELSDDERDLIAVLGTRAAAAVVRQTRQERVQQEIRSREEILRVVVHDLRNPINVIALSANGLMRRLPDSSARGPVERIVHAAQRADRLIHSLLEVDAIEGGRFSISTGVVETADPVLAALESQQSLAANSSVIISTDLSPELPPIEADEERILEVLENLIGNAIKFTSPGGSVTVGAGSRYSEILFWVRDTGSGIPSEALPHLFDRFWQLRRRDRRGTGLGLTICKAIVEAHGGRIWAESSPDRGTTMYFTVPAASRVPKAAAPTVANILLVDDRPENLLSLTAILERPEYRIVTATSGEQALGLALRENFSVALIDIAMPGMNGLEVATHFKELERSRGIPIIFITAFGDDPREIHRAYAAGGADYLVKPLDSEIVRKKVAVFVDLSRRRGANESREENGSSTS
jgi:signal transduction histidine kinase/CheY-like chemotaxis protein